MIVAFAIVFARRVTATLSDSLGGWVRLFDAAGGIPQVYSTDRMGVLGRLQGRRFIMQPPVRDFAVLFNARDQGVSAGDVVTPW